jgi:hypothetical protein
VGACRFCNAGFDDVGSPDDLPQHERVCPFNPQRRAASPPPLRGVPASSQWKKFAEMLEKKAFETKELGDKCNMPTATTIATAIMVVSTTARDYAAELEKGGQ